MRSRMQRCGYTIGLTFHMDSGCDAPNAYLGNVFRYERISYAVEGQSWLRSSRRDKPTPFAGTRGRARQMRLQLRTSTFR